MKQELTCEEFTWDAVTACLTLVTAFLVVLIMAEDASASCICWVKAHMSAPAFHPWLITMQACCSMWSHGAKHCACLLCSYDNAEVYAGGDAERVMGQAIKVWHKPDAILLLRFDHTASPAMLCWALVGLCSIAVNTTRLQDTTFWVSNELPSACAATGWCSVVSWAI